ncbi:MAG: HTH domain-containing protein [Abditibacteriales bacterium]|nr:HTH domain-containing protein [Abditibacteriales bacterium]MDW8365617.1 HTH domain-containing protein [Abditibacteriales bacterium]
MHDRLGARRQQILTLLKKNKSMTVPELAQATAITEVGVRQHLALLERDGLVMREELTLSGRGRPRILYRPTPAADRFFAQTATALLLQIVDYLSQSRKDKKIDQFFARRMQQQKEAILARTQGLPFEEKVKELARICDEDGFMAEVETLDGELMLTEHHCPIFDVAQKFPQACHYEMELFRAVLGVDLVRDKHLPCGDGMCRYRIAPPKEEKKKN